MKNILPIFAICIFTIISCQSDRTSTHEKTADEFMQNTQLRFDGPAKFAAIHAMIRTRAGEPVPQYQVGDIQREYNKAIQASAGRTGQLLDWKERGPANCGGRTRDILILPEDTTFRTWLVGSVGGGIWKTSNAGGDWELMTKDIPNLATSTLAMSPADPDVIYAGTGEGYGNIDGILGSGMLKSVDNGNNWAPIASTSNNNDFANVTRIIVNPENENELLVASIGQFINGVRMSFIMKSVDGGDTWSKNYFTSVGRVQQIVFAPNDFSTQYACVNSRGIFKSIDGGDTWNQIWDGRSHRVRRIEMAISRLNAGVIYLSCETNDKPKLFFTRDTFQTIHEPIFEGQHPNWLSQQGWYDNTIAVHPYNDSLVWVAGAGPMHQIRPGTELDTLKVYDEFENNTSYFTEMTNSPFSDESAGLASDLFQGLPVNPQTTIDDLVNVEILFGPGRSQKAHLMDVNVYNYDFTYNSMIDVPFEAYDTDNGRQISLSVFDVNGDGDWTFTNYDGQPFPFHDVVTINMIDYTDTGDITIQTLNPIYKAQYYSFMQRDTSYQGDKNSFPDGNFRYLTTVDQGLLSDFEPITDGYFQFASIKNVGSKGVHVDHHNIIFIPLDDTAQTFYVLNANDGGVAFSEDNGETFIQTGTTFNDGSFQSSFGYNVSQFYGVDKMNGADRYVGGTQDNGTWVSDVDPDETSNWSEAPSGDGFEAAWNYDNPDLILETSQFNGLFKSYDSGNSWSRIALPGGDGPFITRVAASQIEADLVFMVSEEGVLKSTDFGDTWTVIDMPESWTFHRSWGPPIEVSTASPHVVWTGGSMQDENGIVVSINRGDSFMTTNNYPDAFMGTVTGLATNPLDSTIGYALFSQANGPKILRTADLGQSWKDLSGFITNTDESNNGFPDVATYCLMVMPWDTAWMWAGTEIGIIETKDGGVSWQLADNGLPPVAIWEIKIVGDEVVLATHGRGVWSLDVSELDPVGTVHQQLTNNNELNVFPNPVADQTAISYQLHKKQHISVGLYDINGRLVRLVFKGVQSKGDQLIKFNKGQLASGTYFIMIENEFGQRQ